MLFFIISVFDRLSERVMNCFFRLRGREEEGGMFAFSQSAALRSAAKKKDIQIISSGQPVCSFSIHLHEETSESLINFWIINL